MTKQTSNNSYITIKAIYLKDSPSGKRALIDPIKKGEKQFLPKSQIRVFKDKQEVLLPVWLAKAKGLV